MTIEYGIVLAHRDGAFPRRTMVPKSHVRKGAAQRARRICLQWFLDDAVAQQVLIAQRGPVDGFPALKPCDRRVRSQKRIPAIASSLEIHEEHLRRISDALATDL